MSYQIQITKILPASSAGVNVEKHEVLFTQIVEDLNVQKFIRDLNAMPRRRKSRAKEVAS